MIRRLTIVVALALLPVAAAADFQSAAGTPSRIVRHSYVSPAMGQAEEFNVYLPPGYDARRADPYPVFYLLHGADGDASSWIETGDAKTTLDKLISQRAAVPMVVVMPLGRVFGDDRNSVDRFRQAVVNEIMPQVEKTYRVSTTRNGRAIAGLSMGAGQAVAIGFAHPDRFAWIGGFSGQYGIVEQHTGRSLETSFDAVDPRALASLKLLYLTCGSDDPLLGWTSRLNDVLTAKGVHTTYRELPNFGHVWPLWRQNFADMAQLVFR